ncbi:MAG: hypothetical protein HGA25_00755 [Clostridiales bacterium]|nr:hypothetical protein [Clostridiales bacterium]
MTDKTLVRNLFNIPRLDIWNIPDVPYLVLYENNVETEQTKRQIIFNRYCWELFTLFPNTPIISTCDCNYIMNKEYYNADTHIRLLETIFKHICEYNNLHTYSSKETMLKLVMQIVNLIRNEVVTMVSPYVSGIDATDFVEVIKHQAIADIQSNLRPTPEHIDRAYKLTKQSMGNINPNNRFVKAYRSKSINENQANQCIGPRGFVTDLDRTVFKQPIVNGFIKGMGNLFEIMTESRTAAKSLNANDTHIKTSEYASRRIQLLTMSVRNIFNGDCGSTEYMDVFITQQVLDNMKGIYYLKEDGKLDWLRGNETNLINQVIKVRTTLGCRHPVEHEICTTCLGKISENFKENSNLGYIMTSYLMEKSTQTILSTKHLTHSVKKSAIKLEGNANKYFYTDDENNIYFNKDLDLTGMVMILPNSRLSKLVDVLNIQHTNIALNKIGELEEIIIKDTKHKTPLVETIDISYRDRTSIITKGLLEHIKNSKLESDARGNFVIHLDNYDKERPVFNNPLKEGNIISFVNKITSIIETNKDKVDDPYEKLGNLFAHIIDQFKCNFSILQVMIYATTTYNAYNNNYRLGRNSVHPHCEQKTVLFRHRSLSQLLIFEEQSKELISNAAIMFSNVNRSSHPMDVLFMPQAIVK